MKFRVFSYAHQVFGEMFERAFIHVLGQLTYAEKWDQLSSVDRENDKYFDMRIVQILVRFKIVIFVV